jgi:hypothetical protein
MSLLLQKTKKLKMLLEFLPYGLTQFGIEPKDYLELLLKYNLKLFSIVNRKKKIEPTYIAELLKNIKVKNNVWTNLLLVKEMS